MEQKRFLLRKANWRRFTDTLQIEVPDINPDLPAEDLAKEVNDTKMRVRKRKSQKRKAMCALTSGGIMEVRHLARSYRRHRGEHNLDAYRTSRNQYVSLIRKTKQQRWE